MKVDEIAMFDEKFKDDVVDGLNKNHVANAIWLRNINDTLSNIGSALQTLGDREFDIQNSIDSAGNRIEAAINRHARAAKRMAMSATEKSAIDDACVKAIWEARFSDVKALINSGANVHHRSGPYNRTLFSLACSVGNKAILQLLLENDVTTGDRDAEGQTPMDHARAVCTDDVLRFLGRHGIR